MASYQDLETRIQVLEDKIKFVMTRFQVGVQSPILGAPPTVKSFEQLYYEHQGAGKPLDAPSELS